MALPCQWCITLQVGASSVPAVTMWKMNAGLHTGATAVLPSSFDPLCTTLTTHTISHLEVRTLSTLRQAIYHHLTQGEAIQTKYISYH